MTLSNEELDWRAGRIVSESKGIHPPYEAFYIQAIMYTADRVLEAFERYDAAREQSAAGPDQVSPVHEALAHAASLSRYFWPSGAGPRMRRSLKDLKEARAETLRVAFRVTNASPLKDRSLRDALEHFDERLDRYLLSSDAGQYIPLPRVGDSRGLPASGIHVFKLVDHALQQFVVLDRTFAFAPIRQEATRILLAAREMSKTGDRLPQQRGSE